jgi:dihydroflavonol-4-reductase
MKALVLGATGHLGSALTRELLTRGWTVTAASRRSEVTRNLLGLPVVFRTGNPNEARQLDEWVEGQDLIVDAAAPYNLWLDRRTSTLEAVRAAESRMDTVLQTAARHGASLAYVSSFTTVARSPHVVEAAQSRALRLIHPYCEIKRAMECRVLAAVENGLNAVIVNPTICLGPWDPKSWEFCLIPLILRGVLPATTDHAVNVIDVRDVASATMMAFEQQRFGEPILLTGHNTTDYGLVDAVCRIGCVRPPPLRVPAHLAAFVSYGNELLYSLGVPMVPYPCLGLLLLLEQQWQAPGRRQRDIGLHLRPLSRTLTDAIDWYRDVGYLNSVPALA